MKIYSIFRKVSVFFISTLLLIALGCRQQSTSPTEGQESGAIDKDQVKESVNEVIQHIPSPFELTAKLNKIGAEFIETSINPVDNIDKYFTEKDKALNLGVYSADLAYVSTYEIKQEVNLYADAVKKLIDQLNIKIDLAQLSSEETKEKIENKDSLALMMSNTFYDVYDFLNENSDPSLAALVATGLWVEGMYLAMQISEETFNNNEFVQIILDQKLSLEKLIELLDIFKEEERIAAYKNALIKLKEQYATTDGSLTLEQLKQIGQTIGSIRSGIVG